MPPSESTYPKDWLRIAEKDVVRVNRALDDGDAELAGFCLQQATEKALKALLLARGWQLRRIHDLEALLSDAAGHDPAFERFRSACQTITGYYMLDRYPFIGNVSLTVEDVRGTYQAVQPLFEKVRNATG